MASTPVNQWAAQTLRGLGLEPTAPRMKAMLGWARAEGGNSNGARYNFLNTTQPEPGAGNTGTQGNIKVYGSLDQGVKATVETLKNGRYGGIISALRANNPGGVAAAIGASPWGTSGSLVRQTIAQTNPGSIPSTAAAPATPSTSSTSTRTVTTTPGVDNSALRQQLVGNFLQAGGVKSSGATLAFAAGMQGARDVPGTRTVRTSAATPGVVTPAVQTHAKPGSPVASLTSEGGLHQTEGLPGYPAHDYFAPAGSAVVAPVTGKVIRRSGHDPAQGPVEGPHGPLGWSVYIQGDDGRTYYLTHMGSRNVRDGETVHQGQRIGTVANYAKYGTPSHIHMGVNG